MLYQIDHQTTYNFSQPVLLKPHILRLRPHCNSGQKLGYFAFSVQPQPQGISEFIDLDGNNLIKLWFTEPTKQLKIQVSSQVETYCTNPFNYLLEPWATTLPFDYPASLASQLKLYLQSYSFVPDPVALELAQKIAFETNNNTIDFLFALNQLIYQNCQYITRDTGESLPAGVTWRKKQGSCRDFVVLFMEVCRAIGLAARFVSGYQEGDPDQDSRDLHAWVEVYLPGGGWRGYDPTLGLAVSDRHVSLAASAIPSYAAPIVGSISPVAIGQNVTSQLHAQIHIKMREQFC